MQNNLAKMPMGTPEARPASIQTDVYDYLMGDGFVVVGYVPIIRSAGPPPPAADPNPTTTDPTWWGDIECGVAELERLLK